MQNPMTLLVKKVTHSLTHSLLLYLFPLSLLNHSLFIFYFYNGPIRAFPHSTHYCFFFSLFVLQNDKPWFNFMNVKFVVTGLGGEAMEQKSWRWRRKASEKTVVENATATSYQDSNPKEDQEGGGARKCPSNISDRAASVICEYAAKDELIREHSKREEQALEGQRATIAEASYFKQELDKALQQGEGDEQKLAQLNSTLKDCIQEIESLRVVTVNFEKEKKLEGKLAEANKRVGNLSAENGNLMKALLCKEKLVQDLDKEKVELEAELSMLMGRLDSAEKENTFLKYEIEVMEKELELRDEERKNIRRSELDNVKKIKKLEVECHQLRNLVRKRLQGPIVPLNTKRPNSIMGDSLEKSGKESTFLIEKICSMEEENRVLKEILALSDSELQSWRIKYNQMASKVAELRTQVNELSEAENSMQLAMCGISNFDEIHDSESWANALLAELEQFRQEKIKNEPVLDRFPIMTSDAESSENQLQSACKELIPIALDNLSCKEKELPTQNSSWLDKILKVILDEYRLSKRSVGKLLQDIKIALGCDDLQKYENHCSEIQGLLTWESIDCTSADNATPESISSNNIFMEDASFAREKLRKHYSFGRSKNENQMEIESPNRHNTVTQMIAIQSKMQEEHRQVKEKLQRLTKEKIDLNNQLQESKQTIESLQRELESIKESKGFIEEQVENQMLINEDLDTQLTVGKAKLNETLHKLSSLEVELEDKNNCCEELEGTCLELQLQLETNKPSGKKSPGDTYQVAKKLRTETIQNLIRQLKALPSPVVPQFNEFLSPITTVITIQKSLMNNKKGLAVQRSTLRDCMMEDGGDHTEDHNNLRAEEKEESNRDSSEKHSINHNEFKALPPPDGLKVQSLKQEDTLALAPAKKPSGGFGFIRKLFLRRKRGSSKTKAAQLQRKTSSLNKQGDILLLT